MKTIGLLGGMSWQSTIEYYRSINEATSRTLGGLHSARCLLYSVDFAEIEALMRRGRDEDWKAIATQLASAAQRLEAGGADLVLLCTNTMHRVADAIQQEIRIPFLHIVDPTARAIQAANLHTIGLLGTRTTMEHDFYKGRLRDNFGIDVLIPDTHDRETAHRIIFEELCHGHLRPESREKYVGMIDRLVAQGAQGIILGCTEIGLLIHQEDSPVPLFDTTKLHATAAVEEALTR